MATYVLAGDVGGTKTALAIYVLEQASHISLVREARFASQAYSSLEMVVGEFLQQGREVITASAFGVPGPVLDGEAQITNLPWRVSASKLALATKCTRVRLMNDLETTAYGSLFLPPDQLLTLNPGKVRSGHRAIIAAGTGLGQAFLFWDGARYWPAATEGGHVDFAPRSDQETALLSFLRTQYGRVSCERVITGPGLVNIFNFLTREQKKTPAGTVRDRMQSEDPAAVIGKAGIEQQCPTCSEAVELFLSAYGAQAGNLALTVMAFGGVYIGGGIITKMLPRLETSGFLPAFLDKGRHAALMADIPVQVILNPATSQLGAAHAARELLEGQRA